MIICDILYAKVFALKFDVIKILDDGCLCGYWNGGVCGDCVVFVLLCWVWVCFLVGFWGVWKFGFLYIYIFYILYSAYIYK